MHQVILHNLPIVQVLELRDKLLTAGLVQDQDFVWHYHPSQWHNEPGSMSYRAQPPYVVFEFEDPAMATFYQLKWAQ